MFCSRAFCIKADVFQSDFLIMRNPTSPSASSLDVIFSNVGRSGRCGFCSQEHSRMQSRERAISKNFRFIEASFHDSFIFARIVWISNQCGYALKASPEGKLSRSD